MGGRHSWLSAAGGHGLAGAVGFYGRTGEGADGSPGPDPAGGRDGVPDPRAPGRRRRSTSRPRTTPPSRRRSRAAGVEHELVTYAGAPHSFFDRKYEEFADASDDAWQRVLAFIEQHA